MKDKTYQSTLNIETDFILNLYNQKEYEKALKLCISDDDLNMKGLCLKELKKFDEAIRAFDRALKLNPSDEIKSNKANALYLWAKKLYFPDYDYDGALRLVDEAIKLDENSEYYFLKAEILESMGENIEAKKYYFKAHGETEKLDDLTNQLNLFDDYKNDVLINITGYGFYKGMEVFKKGLMVDLVKDFENEHDRDAIEVLLEGETLGYVANSDFTVIDNVSSASSIKHLFKTSAKAEILFIYLGEMVIARLII